MDFLSRDMVISLNGPGQNHRKRRTSSTGGRNLHAYTTERYEENDF